MKEIFKSKRFVAFSISMVVFVLSLILTDFEPIPMATALTMISGIYLGAETLRESSKK